MFTGIIETLGRVENLSRTGQAGARLAVAPERPLAALAAGESIAVNGVCLTAEKESTDRRLVFFASPESLTRSTLGELRAGDAVNLERALRADGRLGGHLVMGHVDAIGTIQRLERVGEAWDLEVAYPRELASLIAQKGSIAVDGISLTVAALGEGTFTVAVIPFTYDGTRLSRCRSRISICIPRSVRLWGWSCPNTCAAYR